MENEEEQVQWEVQTVEWSSRQPPGGAQAPSEVKRELLSSIGLFIRYRAGRFLVWG